MNIYIALDLFAAVILIYCIIINFFTMLFRFTGLPEEKARFQVMSILTGCGFTTDESELITNFRQRRRMALATMLFGYVFNITIVSTFVNVFLSFKIVNQEKLMLGAVVPLALILLVFMLLRVPRVRVWENHILEKLARKLLHRTAVNTAILMDYIGTEAIVQVDLQQVPESLRDVPLAESGLKADRNIMVMLVGRGGRKPEAPDGNTVFQAGDKLTVFGNFKAIREAFQADEQFMDLESKSKE